MIVLSTSWSKLSNIIETFDLLKKLLLISRNSISWSFTSKSLLKKFSRDLSKSLRDTKYRPVLGCETLPLLPLLPDYLNFHFFFSRFSLIYFIDFDLEGAVNIFRARSGSEKSLLLQACKSKASKHRMIWILVLVLSLPYSLFHDLR